MLTALAALAMPGCVTAPSPQMKDSLGYVHQHKGEGARRVLLGSEAELMNAAVEGFAAINYVVVREPHALFVTPREGRLAYAFYFTPQTSDRTEIEALIASRWFTAEQVRSFQNSTFAAHFPIAYLNTRLLEADFDPNAKGEGWDMLPLNMAALNKSKVVARKLVARGAKLDLAMAEMKERIALRQNVRSEFWKDLDKQAQADYERDSAMFDAGVALLESLKGDDRQVEAPSAPPASAAPKAAGGKGDIADRLRKLDELKRQGLVTEEEYKRKKQELIDQL